MRDACGRERSNVLLVEEDRFAEAWDELLLHHLLQASFLVAFPRLLNMLMSAQKLFMVS